MYSNPTLKILSSYTCWHCRQPVARSGQRGSWGSCCSHSSCQFGSRRPRQWKETSNSRRARKPHSLWERSDWALGFIASLTAFPRNAQRQNLDFGGAAVSRLAVSNLEPARGFSCVPSHHLLWSPGWGKGPLRGCPSNTDSWAPPACGI